MANNQNDFYSAAIEARLNTLAAEEQAALADASAYRANNDPESAGNAAQQIANVRAERANLLNLHREYIASQTPPAQPELTAEERAAKPWSRMDASDIQLAKGSKYGKNLTWDDPHMRAGYAEAQRRRARGE